jgi:hypothetical protein
MSTAVLTNRLNSVADSVLDDGNKPQAIANYQKSLQLTQRTTGVDPRRSATWPTYNIRTPSFVYNRR